MHIAFRADASLQMGNGHVMRCLTLADVLRQKGAECHFLCREHRGHLIELIRSMGHAVHVLPCAPDVQVNVSGPAHAAWLGTTQEQDVLACRPILRKLQPQWLIVDHYALDIRWEEELRACCRFLMVIDDLADRPHQCDLLLDQNLGRQISDYVQWVPEQCRVLTGPHYALLRPEFSALRAVSLERREVPHLGNILISMGGVDGPNATSQVLDALRECTLPDECQLNVVMGPKAPWLQRVRAIAKEMPWPTSVLVNVVNMAEFMARSDLSIGAAGSTSWERCCLGIPSILLVLADNQRFISLELDKAGAAKSVSPNEGCLGVELQKIIDSYHKPAHLGEMSKKAASICDGLGAERVRRVLLAE